MDQGDRNNTLDIYNSGKYNILLDILNSERTLNFQEKILLTHVYCDMENSSKAEEMIRSINENYIPKRTKEEQLQYYIIRSRVLIGTSNPNAALNFLTMCNTITRDINNPKSLIKVNLLYANYFITLGDLVQGKKYLDKIDTKIKSVYNSSEREFGEWHHLFGLYFSKKDDLDKAISEFIIAKKISRELGNRADESSSVNQIGIIHFKKGDLDNASDSFQTCLELNQDLDNSVGIAKSLNNLGVISGKRGWWDQALHYYEESVQFSLECDYKSNLINCYNNIGNIHNQNGNIEDALVNYRKALSIVETTKNDTQYSMLLGNVGLIHKSMGEFKQAEEYISKSLNISRQLDNKESTGRDLNNLGSINYLQGNLNNAEEQFQEALSCFSDIGNVNNLYPVYLNLGQVYQKRGNYRKARDFFTESYMLRKQLGNDLIITEALFKLMMNELDSGQIKNAEKYLKDMKKIASKSDNTVIINRCKIAEANIYRMNNHEDYQLKSHQLLEEVLSGDFLEYELKTFAMLSLCEYFIMEIKSTGSKDAWEGLEETVQKLYDTAIENESHELIAETLIIQSKLAQVSNNTDKARYLLKEAKEICETHGIQSILLKISYLEIQSLQILFNLEEDNLSDRVEKLQLEEYVQNLYFQKEATDLLLNDIQIIQKLNINLSKLLTFEMKSSSLRGMRDYAQIVELSSRELQMLISSLKTLEKIEKNELIPHFETVDLMIFLKEKLALYSLRIEKRNLKIEINELPDKILVRSDRFLVSRILDNLIVNAIKFSPKNGTIKFSSDRGISGIGLLIENSSLPLEKEVLAQVFDKYYQFSPENQISKGFGIGLTFCKRAIELLNGEIDFSVIDHPSTRVNIKLTHLSSE